jgi:chondroitin 4-sulfotransferase 11
MSVMDSLVKQEIHPGRGPKFHENLVDYSQQQIDDNFKFTFIRNPWERLVSHYCFQGPGAPVVSEKIYINQFANYITRQYRYPNTNRSKEISFGDFVKDYVCNDNIEPDSSNFYINKNINLFLEDHVGELNMDFIGRCENFENDFRKLCELLNMKNMELSHVNKQAYAKYTEFYDAYLIDLVAEFFRSEIEMFDFIY